MLKLALKVKKALKLKKFYDNILLAFQKIYTNIDLIIRVPNIRWILKKRYLEEKTKGDMIIMTVVSMSYLLEAGVHFGHQTKRWNPKMKEYIFNSRDDIYIIDLQKTVEKMEEAYAALNKIAADGGKVLYVGTKKQAQEVCKEEAERSNMYYVTERWLGGTLTNFKTIRRRINRLEEIEKMEKDGTLNQMENKWMGNNEDIKKLNDYNFSNKNGTIKFATVSGSAPFSYIKNNEIVGYDIEVISYICEKLEFNLEIIEMSFEGIIPALKSGKVDVAGCSIIVTEERKKSVLFSTPDYTGGIVVVVRK